MAPKEASRKKGSDQSVNPQKHSAKVVQAELQGMLGVRWAMLSYQSLGKDCAFMAPVNVVCNYKDQLLPFSSQTMIGNEVKCMFSLKACVAICQKVSIKIK